MNSSAVDGCLSYIKFGYDFDGIDFSETAQDQIEAVGEKIKECLEYGSIDIRS